MSMMPSYSPQLSGTSSLSSASKLLSPWELNAPFIFDNGGGAASIKALESAINGPSGFFNAVGDTTASAAASGWILPAIIVAGLVGLAWAVHRR